MATASDEFETFPATQVEQITPTATSVLTMVHENLSLNFRTDQSPNLDLPSLWRLAKIVVNERGPILVHRFKEPKQ
jgi:hypothetical protein